MNSADRDWRDRAACRYVDPEIMFPLGEDSTRPRLSDARYRDQVATAKAVCDRCPVVEPCLRWAQDNRIRHGVWGGLTTSQRDTLARRTRDEAVPGPPERLCGNPACGRRIRPGRRYCQPACRHAGTVGTSAGRQFHAERREDPCPDCRAGRQTEVAA